MTKRTRKPKGQLTPTADVLPSGLKDGELVTIGGGTGLDGTYTFKAAKKPRKKRQPKSMGTGAMSIETANWLREEEEKKFPILNEEDVIHTYEDGAKLLTNGAIYIPVKKGPDGPAEIKDTEGAWFGPEPSCPIDFETICDQLAENPFDRPQEEFVTVGDFETPPVEPPKDFFRKEEDFELAPDYRTGEEIRNEWKRLKEETLQDIVNAMKKELQELNSFSFIYIKKWEKAETKKKSWGNFYEEYKKIIREYRDKILTYQLIYGDEAVSLTLD